MGIPFPRKWFRVLIQPKRGFPDDVTAIPLSHCRGNISLSLPLPLCSYRGREEVVFRLFRVGRVKEKKSTCTIGEGAPRVRIARKDRTALVDKENMAFGRQCLDFRVHHEHSITSLFLSTMHMGRLWTRWDRIHFNYTAEYDQIKPNTAKISQSIA